MHRFATLLILLCLFCSAHADTLRVLFIGNSYTYCNNLPGIVQAMADATEEESIAAREEFVEKESEAMAGLVNIANNASSGAEIDNDTIKQSVSAVLGSDVCMNTVTQTVENNSAFTEKVQEATQTMDEETKAEVQTTIESALEDYRQSAYYDPAKEQQYSDLANLFGITLGNGMLPAFP